MKRQKRDKIEHAYHLGYKTGIRGKSANLCPYALAEMRGSWMGGWREGREDYFEGYADLEPI